MIERLTDAQQQSIERILKKLDTILEGEDEGVVISALMFHVLAVIQHQRNLSQADAIQYAAHHLKNYAHMIGYS